LKCTCSNRFITQIGYGLTRSISFALYIIHIYRTPNSPFCSSATEWTLSEHITIGRLCEFLVIDHFILDPDEDFLHGIWCVPVFEHMEFTRFNCSIGLVHTGQIDLWVKFKGWSLSWVLFATCNGKHVDTIVKVGVWWTNDSAVPVCETFVVSYYYVKMSYKYSYSYLFRKQIAHYTSLIWKCFYFLFSFTFEH